MNCKKRWSPAEWELQEATWLAFPHNKKNWSGELGEKAKKFYFDLILKITKFQNAKILVPKDFQVPEDNFFKLDKNPFKAEFIRISTDDIWIRDYGPFFVKTKKGTEIVKTEFNAWGEKFPPWNKDNQVPEKIAKLLNMPFEKLPYIFEGGAIEFNDMGLGITTVSCLIGEKRNNEKEIIKIRRELKKVLGLRDLIALPKGLHGDHTDGHIDNFARFVKRNRVVMAWEKDTNSPNFPILNEAKLCLEIWLAKHFGNDFVIDTLPLPPQKKLGEEILPASYLNFIFVNGGLIFPKYFRETDKIAEAYFKSIFPDREIIGINAKDIIREGGSLHCLTKHQSA